MSFVLRFVLCLIWLPIDLARLTVDAWRLTLEGFSFRVVTRQPDQPCICCRGLDLELCPRPVHNQVRYWNPWLLKTLHPELRVKTSARRLRPLVFCACENGYVRIPRYTPAVAVGLLLGWMLCLLWGLRMFDLLPAAGSGL